MEEALDWLYAQTRAGAPRSPETMERLLRELDLKVPQQVAHVVGTNGKGSVAAMIAAGLTAAGERTGRFLSPHVEDFSERIAVDGQLLPAAELDRLINPLRALTPGVSFFELTLVMALRYFREQGVTFLALEAGVGARNDATLALGNTAITVVTSIALDHTDVLGDTLRQIARDKAAAVRPGKPVISALSGDAFHEIDAAGGVHVHPSTHKELFELPAGTEASGTRLANQRLAAAALRRLGASEAAVAAGVSTSALPGRGERFTVQGTSVLLDGAHDPAAARALLADMQGPFVLIYSGLQRKQLLKTLEPLAVRARAVILTGVNGEEAPESPGARSIQDHQEALDEAIRLAGDDASVLIAGSLYLAGEFRPLLRSLQDAPAALV